MLWLIVLIAIVIIFLVTIGFYNRFVVLRNRINNALAQIDVQLKKRADLVPNLIETVRGYVKHEEKMINAVTRARKELIAVLPEDVAKKVKAGDALQSALKSLFAIAENYPKLRANENFLKLQEELTAIEDKIAYARQFYNDSVLELENAIKTIPGRWFATLFKIGAEKYIKIPEAERAPVKVKF
ncbi:MAG: LemA family protein [Candidatus Pacearchaeota archaeon]